MSVKNFVTLSTFLLLCSGSSYAMDSDLGLETPHSPSKMLVEGEGSEIPVTPSVPTTKIEEKKLDDGYLHDLAIGKAAEAEEDEFSSTVSLAKTKEGMELEEVSTTLIYPKKPSKLFNEDDGPVSFIWEELIATVAEQTKAAKEGRGESIEEDYQNKTREQVLAFYLTEYNSFRETVPGKKYTLPFDPKNPDLSICQKDLDGALLDSAFEVKNKLKKKIQIALGQDITNGSTKDVLDKMIQALGRKDAPRFKTSQEGLKLIKKLVTSFLADSEKRTTKLKEISKALSVDTTDVWSSVLKTMILPDFAQRLSERVPSLKAEIEAGKKAKAQLLETESKFKEVTEAAKNQLSETERKLKEVNEAAKKKEEELSTHFATALAEVKRAHEAHQAEEAKKLAASGVTIKTLTDQFDAEAKKAGSLTTQLEEEKKKAAQLVIQLTAKEKELEGKTTENKRFMDAIEGIEKHIAGLRTGASAAP